MTRKATLVGGLIFAAAVAVVGCNKTHPSGEKAASPTNPEGHGHKPGAHGGILVSLGKDSYHAEAVFTADGAIRLYTLGKDEARVEAVEIQELVGFVTPVGSSATAEEVKFVAEAQAGDPKDKTSVFVGKLPPALAGKAVQVTINNFRIGAERFRLAFSNEAAAAMPAKLGSEKEQRVFLTPGGLYTAADVAANGNTVPSVKYAGVDAQHDDDPKPGDRICPISKTKANPKITWVVGGKTYPFCCTPCVQEFVVKAKEKPAEILDPAEYVKK